MTDLKLDLYHNESEKDASLALRFSNLHPGEPECALVALTLEANSNYYDTNSQLTVTVDYKSLQRLAAFCNQAVTYIEEESQKEPVIPDWEQVNLGLRELRHLVAEIETDYYRAHAGDNAAGTRVRAKMQEVRKAAKKVGSQFGSTDLEKEANWVVAEEAEENNEAWRLGVIDLPVPEENEEKVK